MEENLIGLNPQFDWDHSIGAQLLCIKKDLTHSENNLQSVDLKGFNFSPPLLAIHFATKIMGAVKINPSIKINNSNSYLEIVRFPKGINPGEESNWEQILDSFKGRTYLPIVRFPLDHSKKSTDLREAVLNHVLKSLKTMTGIPTNYYSGVSYLISELTDNLVDHSKSDFGYIMFQYYQAEKIMDICICDKGIGVLGAYQSYSGEKDFSHISSHIEAVQSAIKGFSTKNIPERGYGFATSRSMLTDGLKGRFVFLSGDALLIDKNLFNFNSKFNGTIALIRIPLHSCSKDFSYDQFAK